MSSDPRVVMRYVAASKGPGGPLVAMQQDVQKMMVTRKAALPLEYGVRGEELIRELRKGAEKFIRAMELQGLELIPLPDGNPQCVTYPPTDARANQPYGTYSITADLDRPAPSREADERGEGTPTWLVPQSLEDSKGMVDYHFIGVFWAPAVTQEILRERQSILDEERARRNPTTWGGGSTTPNRPSISR